MTILLSRYIYNYFHLFILGDYMTYVVRTYNRILELLLSTLIFKSKYSYLYFIMYVKLLINNLSAYLNLNFTQNRFFKYQRLYILLIIPF